MGGLKLSLGNYHFSISLIIFLILLLSPLLIFQLNIFFHLLHRDVANEFVSVKKYKSDVRKQLINDGYRIWGILGDQYSSIEGLPSTKRAFKLPNPMYYVA